MNELCKTQTSQSMVSEQEHRWEEARRANEDRWVVEARHGNILRGIVWTGLHLYLHRGTTPEAIMRKEALDLNRQYDLERN